jgi:mannose-6-phosphate isomerase-like protein (cupin superfamily)
VALSATPLSATLGCMSQTPAYSAPSALVSPKGAEPEGESPAAETAEAEPADAAPRAESSNPAIADGAEAMGRVISPSGVIERGDWTEEELKMELAIRHLRRTEQLSFHRVRALGAEKPHVHDRHDLTVFVLSGSVLVHLGDQTVRARAGDVIDIPKGVPHWVENENGAAASEAFNVFSPPFDGKDRRFLRTE